MRRVKGNFELQKQAETRSDRRGFLRSRFVFLNSLSLSPLTPAIQNPPVPYMPWTRYFLSILLLDKNSLTITKPHFYYCTLSLSLSLLSFTFHTPYTCISLLTAITLRRRRLNWKVRLLLRLPLSREKSFSPDAPLESLPAQASFHFHPRFSLEF